MIVIYVAKALGYRGVCRDLTVAHLVEGTMSICYVNNLLDGPTRVARMCLKLWEFSILKLQLNVTGCMKTNLMKMGLAFLLQLIALVHSTALVIEPSMFYGKNRKQKTST